MVREVEKRTTFLHHAPLFPTNLKKGQPQKGESFVIFSTPLPPVRFPRPKKAPQIMKTGPAMILTPRMFGAATQAFSSTDQSLT
jgi:hypothetical protein